MLRQVLILYLKLYRTSTSNCENAGLEGSVIVERLKHAMQVSDSIATNEWVNMLEEGIVDPTKVTRSLYNTRKCLQCS